MTRLTVVVGDITLQAVEAIVNAANSTLRGGGGVDGAIHRAGGPVILTECLAIVAQQGECSEGQAVITSGGDLSARYVIHTVGPFWEGGREGEPELLASCYRNSLALARDRGLKSVAFPCISTGVFGYPPEQAAAVAVQAVKAHLAANDGLEEVRFVVYSEKDLGIYTRLLAENPH